MIKKTKKILLNRLMKPGLSFVKNIKKNHKYVARLEKKRERIKTNKITTERTETRTNPTEIQR